MSEVCSIEDWDEFFLFFQILIVLQYEKHKKWNKKKFLELEEVFHSPESIWFRWRVDKRKKM